MVFIDGLIPDAFLGINDEEFEKGDVEKESEDVFEEATLYFAQLEDINCEDADTITSEEIAVDEGYFADESEDLYDHFLMVDPLDGIEVLSAVRPEPSAISRRKENSLNDTLEYYCKLFSHVAVQVKSLSYNKKASNEIMRRLIEFYENHNDILPNISLTDDFYQIFDTESIALSLKNQYKHSGLDTYVIAEVQNGKSAREITAVLKRYMEESHVVDGENDRFLITSMNEIKTLRFLDKLKAFYDNGLAEYERNLGKRDIVSYDVIGSIKYFESTRFAVQQNEADIAQIVSPSIIRLDTESFVCGACGDKQNYEYPFIKTALINTKPDDFFTIIPTIEVCAECGSNNLLPSNYFDIISENLKKKLEGDFDVAILRERLNKLSDNFTVYYYNLPKPVILSAIPNDLKSYFVDKGDDSFTVDTVEAVQSVDVSKEIKAYKNKISNLKNKNLLFFCTAKEDKESGLADIEFLNKSKLVAKTYSIISKAFCCALGLDYLTMKGRAISSLLFFLEDYIPFIINPFVVVRESAANLVGAIDDVEFSRISNDYARIIKLLEDNIDYFAFVPITVSNNSYNNLNQFTFDTKMRSVIDHITDSMIINNMRDDLVELCLVGNSEPFANAKVKLKAVLADPYNELPLKKFNKSLEDYSNTYISLDNLTECYRGKKNWLSRAYVSNKDHKEIIDAFTTKDIYDVMKIVFDVGEYDCLKQSLEQFREKFEGKAKLAFYYEDLFPEVDFEKYSTDEIQFFYICSRRLGENFQDYLERVRSHKTYGEDVACKHRAWFSEWIEFFFGVVKEELLSKQKPSDILFMDIMKNIAAYGSFVSLQAFSINEAIFKTSLIELKGFEYPNLNRDKELAKYILYYHSYKVSEIQVLLSECDDDLDTVIAVLLRNTDALEEEFMESSNFIRNILSSQFSLNFA